MKKVLLIVVDALASRVVRPAMEGGELRYFQAFASAGLVDWNCTAIFPSITPAATAALVTGGYPAETGISGAYFYDRENDRVHYYGDDTWTIMNRGFARYFQDFLLELNGKQLRMETAYETVERAGWQAACLNYLWFRGKVAHQVRVPWLLRLWPGVPWSKTIMGPSHLSLGDFASSSFDGTKAKLKGPGGLFRRYGFTDAATAEELKLMAEADAFPEFTVAYFPDNDFVSHKEGPRAALATVRDVDRALGRIAEIYGGVEQMLDSLAIVITGDHAQSDLPGTGEHTGIELQELLDGYSIVPAGQNWRSDDELMICPNMRAVQIYFRPGYWARREEIARRLADDERIDQIIWREGGRAEEAHYCLLTKDRGRLEFAPGAERGECARDQYGATWSWSGNLATVDARIAANGTIQFEQYPNAFERIAMAFDDQVSGDMWATSRLGHEFCLPKTSVNRRGSHASLHAHDSLSPLIIAGFPEELLFRSTPRSVDIAPLCLSVLGIAGVHAVGESHVHARHRRSRPDSV